MSHAERSLAWWVLASPFIVVLAIWVATRGEVKQVPGALIAATVLVADGDGGFGTGVIQKTREHTYVWTAAHCAEDNPHVIYKGVDHTAKVVALDPQTDLAVLEVEPKDFPYGVVFESSINPPKVGTHIFHVGNFFGTYPNSLSDGLISATGRIDLADPNLPTLDQVSAPVFPGSSGGGIFLDNGHLVGLADRQAASTCTFIIPVRVMRAWATKHGLAL